MGKHYPIIEDDLIEVIQRRLAAKQANGELEALHQRWRDNAKAYVHRPPGATLPRARAYRAFAIDPTYTVAQAIHDAEGTLLYPAGTAFNPLQVKPLSKTLCFIDGDDADQVQWLDRVCGDALSFKRILVNGDYHRLRAGRSAKLYFDQHGVLSAQLRLGAVPAVVRQAGHLLYVEELLL